MKTVDDYISEVRRLFFISVDTDIDKWKRKDKTYELSYDKWTSDVLCIDLENCKLYMGDLNSSDKVLISEYKILFITDREVYNYVKKLKEHFKIVDENELNRMKINKMSEGIDDLMKMYKNEYDKKLRKDKLDNLENK